MTNYGEGGGGLQNRREGGVAYEVLPCLEGRLGGGGGVKGFGPAIFPFCSPLRN